LKNRANKLVHEPAMIVTEDWCCWVKHSSVPHINKAQKEQNSFSSGSALLWNWKLKGEEGLGYRVCLHTQPHNLLVSILSQRIWSQLCNPTSVPPVPLATTQTTSNCWFDSVVTFTYCCTEEWQKWHFVTRDFRKPNILQKFLKMICNAKQTSKQAEEMWYL